MGCVVTGAAAQDTLAVPPIAAGEGNIFHTTINAYGNRLSGLTVFQPESDAALRVLFTTFAGPTLLDLRITPGGYEKIYALRQLDRRAVLRALSKDFALAAGFATTPNKKERIVYHYDHQRKIRAELFAKKKKMLTAEYFYACDRLEKILLTHHTFKMTITLLKLTDDGTE
jgi:hypothetical protein